MQNDWLECTEAGVEHYQQARFNDADDYLSRALELARQNVDDKTTLAESLNNYSIVLLAQAKYEKCQTVLKEAIDLVSDRSGLTDEESKALTVVHACCLNNIHRFYAELEKFDLAESSLIEAIDMVRPIKKVYAAEMASNLWRLYFNNPPWRAKLRGASEQFAELIKEAEPIEVYFDDLFGCRRPGKYWDKAGAPQPESIQARLISQKASYQYDYKHAGEADYLEILKIEEESKALPPGMVIFSLVFLADIAFYSGDHAQCLKYCQQSLRTADSSYMRDHPANFYNLLRVGTFFILTNSGEKSQKMFEQAEALIRNSLGHLHPYMAITLITKALMIPMFRTGLTGTEVAAEQERVLLEGLSIAEKFFPPEHSRITLGRVFQADIYCKTGRFEQADKLLHQILKDSETTFFALELKNKIYKSLAELRTKQGHHQEARVYIEKNEETVRGEEYLGRDMLSLLWNACAKLYMDSNFLDDAIRCYKKGLALCEGLPSNFKNSTNLQLAVCLMRAGRTQEANDILSKKNEPQSSFGTGASEKKEDLIAQSREAWSLHARGQKEEAAKIANRVMNEAQSYFPDAEEAFTIGASVLIEQAKADGKPEEMVRLTATVANYKDSIRIRGLLPTLYQEAALTFAGQGSIKAEALFEQALQAAREISSFTPQPLANCTFIYMNHCITRRKMEKALELCESLLRQRLENSGAESVDYAAALTSKAVIMSASNESEAEALTAEAVNILDKFTGDDEGQLFLTLTVRIKILKDLKRFEEAEALEKRHQEVKERFTEKLKKSLPGAG